MRSMAFNKEGFICDKKKERAARFGCRILFYLYLIVMFYFVLFSERYGRETGYDTSHVNLELFKEIKRFWMYRSLLTPEAFITNLVGNVFAFSPFGFLLPVMTEKKRGLIKVVLGSFLFSSRSHRNFRLSYFSRSFLSGGRKRGNTARRSCVGAVWHLCLWNDAGSAQLS